MILFLLVPALIIAMIVRALASIEPGCFGDRFNPYGYDEQE